MPESDTVAKFRRSPATRIEWSLRTNVPADELLHKMQDSHGNTLLTNVVATPPGATLRQPRVLREAASELAALENATSAAYLEVSDKLKRRHGSTTVGQLFGTAHLPDGWAQVPKKDAQPALAEFQRTCGESLPRPYGSAKAVCEFLTSVTVRQFKDLGYLQDVDLVDWQTDCSVLYNVLRQLGNPADWITPWLQAGVPRNVLTRRAYANFYSVLILNAVVATRNFGENLWATKKQWERKGCCVVGGERGAPVFHFFRPDRDEDRYATEGTERTEEGPRSRVSVVFNVNQVRRADGNEFELPNLVRRHDGVDECVSRHDVRVVHKPVESPFYDPGQDMITMPPMTWFQTRSAREQATVDYYATLLHELVHWTGHKSRLARLFGNDVDGYKFEELVAELGSAFLCVRFGLEGAHRLTGGESGVVAYINHYYEDGCDPVDLLIDAAGQANRSANYLIHGGQQQASG